jgi:broad specificity phosphatase PhoE
MATTVYIVRHGQTKGNRDNRYIGSTDIDLTELGEVQAEVTAEYLYKTVKFDKIYSSDLKRAYITAMATAQKQNLEVIKDPAFREFYGGKWENMSFSDIVTQYPNEYKTWNEDFASLRCPDGESVEELSNRAYEAIKRIAINNDGKTIAVFAHGGVIRTLICRLSGKPLSEIGDIPWPTNTSITVAKIDENSEEILVAQNNDHLNDELKTGFKG